MKTFFKIACIIFICKGYGQTGTRPDYIIFGRYCGECYSHCATMYQYKMAADPYTLFVDTTDSFFKELINSTVICHTPETKESELEMASDIVAHIPAKLLTTAKKTERYGCPDCADGCGIYIEIKQDTLVKQFYIDYQTENIKDPDIKAFADYFKERFNQ